MLFFLWRTDLQIDLVTVMTIESAINARQGNGSTLTIA